VNAGELGERRKERGRSRARKERGKESSGAALKDNKLPR